MLYCVIGFVILFGYIEGSTYQDGATFHDAFDSKLYEDVINVEECDKQLSYLLRNDTELLLKFLDASARTPRRVFKGNFKDFGSFWECLDIDELVSNMTVEGKFCMINVKPNITLPEIPGLSWSSRLQEITSNLPTEKWLDDMTEHKIKRSLLLNKLGIENIRTSEASEDLSRFSFELAICIPKVCRTIDVLGDMLQMNVSEVYCRLPNDKPWVAGDYVAITIIAIILALTVVCTSYDIRHNLILKRDPQKVYKPLVIFSVYTNTRRFFTFKSNPEAIDCLDGIRSLAMFWVIIGHTFSYQFEFMPANILDIVEFAQSFWSLWITSALITVDTFFLLSGTLLVYTTAAKLSRIGLIKRLHLFYVNRLIRMFPILAATILFQVSIFNWITDGPYWTDVASSTVNCRLNWWATLLYVQNFINTEKMCLGHTWYLAIDMQLYIIAPLVLFWVLGGNKKSAWSVLVSSLLAVLAGSAVYNALKKFPGLPFQLSRIDEAVYYASQYYIHTLPRASPFFVGLILGYVLHLCRAKTVILPRGVPAILWLMATIGSSASIIVTYFLMDSHWDNQVIDTIVNTIQKPLWAAAVAWLIFACKHGYAGPINWILTLHIFKIFGRMSYAMYLLHYPLVHIHSATALAPIYFSIELSIHRFFVNVALATIASFLVTIFFDSPFSLIISMLLGGSRTISERSDPKKNDELNNKDIPTTSTENDLPKRKL